MPKVLAQMHDMAQNYNDNRKQKPKYTTFILIKRNPFIIQTKHIYLLPLQPFFFHLHDWI